MLDKFKKYFKQPEGDKEATMVDTSTQPDLAAQLASAQETLASHEAIIEAMTAQLAELSEQNKLGKAALAAAEASKAALVQEAAAKRLEARTKAVEASVGTAKAAGILAATDSLNDEQFEAIVSAMAASFEQEAKSPLFKEVGAAAEAKAPEEVDPVARLKAEIAKEFPNQ